jgi:hypothetical protein
MYQIEIISTHEVDQGKSRPKAAAFPTLKGYYNGIIAKRHQNASTGSIATHLTGVEIVDAKGGAE